MNVEQRYGVHFVVIWYTPIFTIDITLLNMKKLLAEFIKEWMDK